VPGLLGTPAFILSPGVKTPARSPFAALKDDYVGARRSLVLAGGGMRVAYQAGVLTALEEADLHFHHVDAASGGTMNLSMLLGGQPSAEICERWRSLDPRQFSSPFPLTDYFRTPHWPGLGTSRGLRDNVFPHLGIDAELVRNAVDISGTYNVCNFVTKTAEVIDHADVDLDLPVAAVSLPVLMPAVMREGTAYTDAVWIRDSNVPEAVRRGSDEIWLVWCIGNTPRYHNGSFRQYVHMIEMAANGSLRRDLEYVATRWPDRQVQLHVIKPEHPIPLDPAYFLGRVDAATLIDLGYQDARRYLSHPRPFSAPWVAAPTGMTEARPGVSARVVLYGPFAMGQYAPAEGAEVGRQTGTELALHLQVEARNLGHGGDLGLLSVAGDVSLPGQRPHTLIEEGTAELSRAGLKLRLKWRGPGRTRSLFVEPVDGGDVLAATLQEEHVRGVLGAGTVSLGWRESARALGSVHATDSRSGLEAMKARVTLALALVGASGLVPQSWGGKVRTDATEHKEDHAAL
jgi:predicted acylesterase/phospholipase RssA